MKKETDFAEQINDIVAENAMLHQSLDIQRMIQAGVNSELLKLKDINTNLRRIIMYILAQNNGSYTIQYKTLIATSHHAYEIGMEVDALTNNWLLTLIKEPATNKQVDI